MSDWFRPKPSKARHASGPWSFGERPPLQRDKVVLNAVLYSLGGLACGAVSILALVRIVSGDTGFVVMLFFFGVPAAILAGFARQYIRDISAEPVVIEGEVIRKWQKGNLLIFFLPSYYIYVADKVFSIRRQEYALLLPGDQVRVRCFPHSLTVEELERYDSSQKRYVPAAGGAEH